MGVVVSGILDMEQMFLEVDSTWKKRSVEHLWRNALRLQKIARAMSPVDEGDLTKAIKLMPETLGEALAKVRSERGTFVKKVVKVYVDFDMPAPDYNKDGSVTGGTADKVVGDYAYVVHSMVTPYGSYKLGKKSEEKNAQSDYEVGGGYMTRAQEIVESQMRSDLVAADLLTI